MNFKEKIFNKFLSKSNSYNYYKNNYKQLLQKNEEFQNENTFLNNKITSKEKEISELKKYILNKEEGFIFTIIIAIYNTEKYLSQSIDSIINQSFPFSKVQIILIDDGSTDGCSAICKEYIKKFPKNIKYIYQENQGQSVARNNGLRNAKGKFVNFLDSDDKLELNALDEVYYHFIKFSDEIDVISIPRYLFGSVNGPMINNYKFNDNRIVDIQKEFDFPQVSISAAFIRKNAISHYFNTRLIISEDSLLLNKIILSKLKFGVVGSTRYMYRKRPENDSTIDTKKINKDYFSLRMEIYFKELINNSLEKYGKVIDYMQVVLIYDLRWLFEQKTEVNVLNDQEKNEFYMHIYDVLQYIDDNLILSQNFSDELKNKMLDFKNGIVKSL